MASPPTRCKCVGPDGRRFTLTSPERKPARGKTPDKKGTAPPKKGPSPPKTGKPPPKKRQPPPNKGPSPPKTGKPSPKKDRPSPKQAAKSRRPRSPAKAAQEDKPMSTETALSPISSSARDRKKSKPKARKQAEPKKRLRRPPRRKTERELNALATLGGLPANATKDEITAAYKKLARENHPDKGADGEMFREIQNAYEVLKPSPKRKFEKN